MCPTLCDPIDVSPPGSPVPGILQARTLEWVAISFSNAWKWKGKVKSLSGVWLLATPWTADYQAPPSMGFSRQEYWSGVPLPSPDLSSSCHQFFSGTLKSVSFLPWPHFPLFSTFSTSSLKWSLKIYILICNHLEVGKLKRLSSLSPNLSHGLQDYIWSGPLNSRVSRTSHNFPNCQGSPYPWIFSIILPFACNILLPTMCLFLWEDKATSFLLFNYHLRSTSTNKLFLTS